MGTMKDFMDSVMKHNEQPDEMNHDFLKYDLCPYCGHEEYINHKKSLSDGETVHHKECYSCQKEWAIIYNSDGEIERIVTFSQPDLD